MSKGTLITCDLICAGIPSPKAWSSFIDWLESRTGKHIANWVFRPKVNGLASQFEIAEFDDGSTASGSTATRAWRHVFGSGAAYRPACHTCIYSDARRPSDVTIGDFWGVEKVLPDFDDGRGVSVVMDNGTISLNGIIDAEGTAVARVDPPLASNERQPALSRPHDVSTARADFFTALSNGGFESGARRLGIATIPNIIKRKFFTLMGKRDSMVKAESADGKELFDDHYATGREDYPICENPLLCTGCTACMMSCPKHAIEMREDFEGFLYPVIDKGKCVECGICRSACPSNGDTAEELKREPVAAYAFMNSDSVRAHSSSGGAFWALAQAVLDKGGIVYGAAFDEELAVRHVRCETVEEARRCCGSKYVQSAIGDSFVKVRTDLNGGRTVLFSGTPCQVAGLKSYLEVRGGVPGRLITVDLLCHGVSSPFVFRNHIDFLAKRHGKIVDFLFRDKSKGWHAYRNVAVLEDGSRCAGYDVGAFQEIFNRNYAARPSCSFCPYACEKRVGEVSLADYWGIEKHHPDIDDDKGTSLVLVRDLDAAVIFSRTSGVLAQLRIGEYSQPVLQAPSPVAPDRSCFWRRYYARGHIRALRHYTCFGMVRRAMRLARQRFRIILARRKS